MTWLFIGLISFVRHPVKTLKYLFGSPSEEEARDER